MTDSTSHINDTNNDNDDSSLCCLFRGKEIPVTHPPNISGETVRLALSSPIFTRWLANCERSQDGKRLDLHGVELQSVDLFGTR